MPTKGTRINLVPQIRRLYGIIKNATRQIIDKDCLMYDKSNASCEGHINFYVLGNSTSSSELQEKLRPQLFWGIRFKPTEPMIKMDKITAEYKMMIRHITTREKGCFITAEEDIVNIREKELMDEINLVKDKRYMGYSFYNNGISDNKVYMWGTQMILWTPELAEFLLSTQFTGHIDKFLSETHKLCKTNKFLLDHSFK